MVLRQVSINDNYQLSSYHIIVGGTKTKTSIDWPPLPVTDVSIQVCNVIRINFCLHTCMFILNS